MITASRLREILEYAPESGEFRWKIHQQGSVAGCSKSGVIKITVNGRKYRAHRLAWLWMTGFWPTDQVDHKDRNPLNNRWSNLRGASSSQNLANKTVRKDSASGVKGVYFDRRRKKYRASIGNGGKQIAIGYYDNLAVASAAYAAAAVNLYGEYAGS